MRSQEYNTGELSELKVKVEKEVVETFINMSESTGYSMDDLVVIAMKRFCASHSDYISNKSE